MGIFKKYTIAEYNKAILDNIRRQCVGKDLSIPKIEKALGYGNGSVSGWSKAKKRAPMDRVEAITHYLGCSINDILPEGAADDYIAYVMLDTISKKMPATNSDEHDIQTDDDSISDYDRRFLAWFHSIPPERRRAILISQDAPKDLL